MPTITDSAINTWFSIICFIVLYGVSIVTVCNNLISNVKYKVENFTGLEIEKVNIFVEGVRVID